MPNVIGVFKDTVSAEKAITELRQMDIDDNNISYVFQNRQGNVEHANAAGEAAKDTTAGAVSGATAGGIIGALAGLAVANGVLPGLGTLFVAGPLATALGLTGAAATTAAGAMTGAAAGGLIGALTGLGASKEDAEMYENRVKGGDILVTATTTEAGDARAILERNGAEEIRELKSA
jgi:hypothetical protein